MSWISYPSLQKAGIGEKWTFKVKCYTCTATKRFYPDLVQLASTLIFNVSTQPAFEIPLQDVAQCFVHKKNEVSMEFHHNEEEAGDAEVGFLC